MAQFIKRTFSMTLLIILCVGIVALLTYTPDSRIDRVGMIILITDIPSFFRFCSLSVSFADNHLPSVPVPSHAPLPAPGEMRTVVPDAVYPAHPSCPLYGHRALHATVHGAVSYDLVLVCGARENIRGVGFRGRSRSERPRQYGGAL